VVRLMMMLLLLLPPSSFEEIDHILQPLLVSMT
jgi:hypothetical protein